MSARVSRLILIQAPSCAYSTRSRLLKGGLWIALGEGWSDFR